MGVFEANATDVPGNGMVSDVLPNGPVQINLKHLVASDACDFGGEGPQVFDPTWATRPGMYVQNRFVTPRAKAIASNRRRRR